MEGFDKVMEEESIYESLDEKLDTQSVDESGDGGSVCNSYDVSSVLDSADNRIAVERSPSTKQKLEHQKNFNVYSNPSGNFDAMR